jgi:hypothetical protein
MRLGFGVVGCPLPCLRIETYLTGEKHETTSLGGR